MAYVSDCALPVNSDVLVPWVEEAGYVNAFGTMAGVFAGIVGIGAVLLVIYGATVRHTSAQWKVILE